MSVIFEINRDFPYQVALSFDEIAMEVLAWLDVRSFEWDMYVDMPAGAVRYCFRTLADTTARDVDLERENYQVKTGVKHN